jgi:hypothetical protein
LFAVPGGLQVRLHRRHRHDAAMSVLQMQPVSSDCTVAGLQQKDAGDDLQAVGDLCCISCSSVSFWPAGRPGRARGPPLRDVLDRQQISACPLPS